MKFRDIALVEQPPKRVSVVHSKAELGTYLGVLAQPVLSSRTVRQMMRCSGSPDDRWKGRQS